MSRAASSSFAFPSQTTYLAREGTFVKKDQKLAQLRTTVLDKQLAAAKAELRHRQSLNGLWASGVRHYSGREVRQSRQGPAF